MKNYFHRLGSASLFGVSLLLAAGAANADALSTPSLTGPLVANPSPLSFDSGLGNVYVTGIISGLAMVQTNHTMVPGDHETLFDFSNAQVSIQKTDGFFQFYVQAGGYSLPTLGEPYVRATTATDAFGVVPVAYIKLAPTDTFNIEAGKLPTLVGAEYTFTFENLDIERGLLWNEEPAISRGVQANYTMGPLAFSLAYTDGAYTNRYNQLSGSLAYTISSSDTLTFVGSGDLGKVESPLAPVANEEVYNVIWAHTSGPWTITPYAQYTNVSSFDTVIPSTSTWGGAILANYAFNPAWSLGGRVEYIKQNDGYDPALYGNGSSAWTFTITPTYQHKLLFVRGDLSYVTANHLSFVSTQGAPGPGFGTDGTETGQFRALAEVGILF